MKGELRELKYAETNVANMYCLYDKRNIPT